MKKYALIMTSLLMADLAFTVVSCQKATQYVKTLREEDEDEQRGNEGPAQSGPTIVERGVQETKSYTLAPFSRIEASSALELRIKEGPKSSVVVGGDQNVIPAVVVESVKGTLKLRLTGSVQTKNPIMVTISCPVLDSIFVYGAVQADLKGISKTLSVSMDGASHATIEGPASKFVVKMNGASTLDINSKGPMSLSANVDSSSRLVVLGEVTEFGGNIDGASKVKLPRVKATTLSADIESSGQLIAAGSVKMLTATAKSGAYLDLSHVQVGKAKVTSDSAAQVELGDTAVLNAVADGASSIRYAGSPHLESTVTDGAGSIQKG